MANVTVCVEPVAGGGSKAVMTIDGVSPPGIAGGEATVAAGTGGFSFLGSSATVNVQASVDLDARIVTFVVTENGTTLSTIDKVLLPTGVATCDDL